MHGRLTKVLLVGNSDAGKTSLLMKAAHNHFTEKAVKTICVDLARITFYPNKEEMQLQVWDTPSGPQYETIKKSYLKGSDAVMICCNKTDPNLQATLQSHTDFVRGSIRSIPIFIILTKADLDTTNSAEPARQASDFAARIENCYCLGEASAKDDTQDKMLSLLEKTMLAIGFEGGKDAKTIFFEKHTKLRWPTFFSHTNISPESSWEDLILDARHKKSAVANKTFLKLKWLDKDGNVTASAPLCVKAADINIRENQLVFKKLG